MSIQLNHISGITLALVAATVVGTPAGFAQDADSTIPQTIPDALNDLLTNYSGDFFENRSISRQAGNIAGFSFPEREIGWDTNATTTAFYDLMLLQNTVDPTLRVPDLLSPYTTTLLTMPSSQVTPYVGTEFIFE